MGIDGVLASTSMQKDKKPIGQADQHRPECQADGVDPKKQHRRLLPASMPINPPRIIDQVAKPISINQMVKPTALTTWSSIGRQPKDQWKMHARPTLGGHHPFAEGCLP